jgi:heme a synthase
VGCLIVALTIAAVRLRARMNTLPVLACGLLAVVLVQGAFGALTVTLRLMPLIVTLHLLGGLLTLLLLTIYALRVGVTPPADAAAGLPPGLRRAARRTLALLFVQVALGGWVSTNYAAPVCGALPLCQGKWWPATDFEHGFEVMRELGRTAAGAELPLQALVAIHLAHRLFALVVFVAIVLLARRLWRAGRKTLGAALVAAVGAQVAIGMKVVWAMSSPHLQLPLQLPAAVAHNAGAATLVVLLAVISFAGFLEWSGAQAGLRAAASPDPCKPQPVPPRPPLARTAR